MDEIKNDFEGKKRERDPDQDLSNELNIKTGTNREIHPITPGSRKDRRHNKDNKNDKNKSYNKFGKPLKEDVFDADKEEFKDKVENYSLVKKSEKFEFYYKVNIII